MFQNDSQLYDKPQQTRLPLVTVVIVVTDAEKINKPHIL